MKVKSLIFVSLAACLAFVDAKSASRRGLVQPTRSALTRADVKSTSRGQTTFRGGAATVATPSKAVDLSKKAAIGWGLLLAFNSGFSNGAFLSGAMVEGTKQAVAAVTGAWTSSAVGFASGNMDQFKTQATMILSYAFGSSIAGALNPTPKAYELSPSTGPALLLASALMYTSANMAGKGADGAALTIFSLAAIANGISNSITSVHTGNLVRSAHYSGMTSDMGTFFGQLIRGNDANLFRLKVCLSLAAAFWMGGYLAVKVTNEYHQTSLLVSTLLYAISGIAAVIATSKE